MFHQATICFLALILACNSVGSEEYFWDQGAIVRGNTERKTLALVMTGHDFGEGFNYITNVLDNKKVKASFFFTGDFYRNPEYDSIIRVLRNSGHYLGAHSDKHLLYCSWENRDSLLVSKSEFTTDLEANYAEMKRFGISKRDAPFYMPPYEWYNQSISDWTNEIGLKLVNYSPGTRSNADYTTPSMKNYISSDRIFESIIDYEETSESGLNGFLLLVHPGTSPERKDKFYYRLEELITSLKSRGYSFVKVNELLN